MKLRISVGVLAIIAIVAMSWVFGAAPLLADAARNDQNRASVQQLNGLYANRIASLAKDRAALDQLRTALTAATWAVPATPDLGDFLAELNSIETKYGVKITGYTAGDPVAPGTGATSSGAAATAGAATPGAGPAAPAATTTGAVAAPAGGPAAKVYTIPVQVQMTGTYSHIVDAIGGLQHGDRLVTVDKVSIAAVPSGSSFAATIGGEVYMATQ